jgi:hypothetical protein
MPQVTCERTGITFEAKPSRTRTHTHPTIIVLLSEADRYGWYSVALTALEAGREAGYTTIEEFVTQLREAEKEWKAGHEAEARYYAQTDRDRDRAETTATTEKATSAPNTQNAQLREHGYKWGKSYDDYNAYEEDKPDTWYLATPDGRLISGEQALDEIERGADVVLAEIASREAAAGVEAEAKVVEEKAVDDRYNAARNAALALPEVQAVEVAANEKVEIAYHRWGEYNERNDQVFRFERNGVECFIIYAHGGYDDDDVLRYFSTDPERAGLVRS